MNVEHITARFEAAFPGSTPTGICTAPGRVNLIGEHVDYSGLSVLPMAIDRNVWAAFSPRTDGTVHIANDDSQYASTSFTVTDSIESAESGDWSNYTRASIQAIHNEMGVHAGMNCLVASDLPAAAGLSSSTALVVATALAYLSCAGRPIDNEERNSLAEILAAGERYVGTQSGGMDHAAILLGQLGHALKIDFHPLRHEPVPLPDECAIVVCNSGIVANKGGASQASYNRGPALCAMIRAMVERHAQQEFGDEIEIPALGEIWHGPLCLTHNEAAELFEGAFTKPSYSLVDVAAYLESNAKHLREKWIGDLEEPDDGFPLRAWARHQYQEHRRVERTRDALLCGDLEAAGRLMNESHASCAEGLGVSIPELDTLVDAAIANGAYGARLTGAGFGGCTVNLLPHGQIDAFRSTMWTGHYVNGPGKELGLDCAENAIFEVTASSGAMHR